MGKARRNEELFVTLILNCIAIMLPKLGDGRRRSTARRKHFHETRPSFACAKGGREVQAANGSRRLELD